MNSIYELLTRISTRPAPFSRYTARELWTDPYIAQRMLQYHLAPDIDAASRSSRFMDRSVEWIADRFQIGPGSRIADFGCGPGLYASRLCRHGCDVTGIDFSANALGYAREAARKSGQTIRYLQADYLNYEPEEPLDLILLIMCDYCALAPEQRRQLLRRIYAALKPDGAVLFDVYSPVEYANHQEKAIWEENLMNGFWSAGRYYGFLNTFKYEAEKLILDRYFIVEEERTQEICNWFQCFTPEELKTELTGCGFGAEEFLRNVAGDPFDPMASEFAVIARKQ